MRSEEYDMSKGIWADVSSDAKDLIRGLLKADPQERMPLDRVLKHPWLQVRREMDTDIGREVLTNLRTFSNTSPFFSFCVALVARQLDHRSLRDVHRIFVEMDTNGDGVLELQELKAGFERIFGENSEQVKNVEEMFSRLDMDGSGKIDYTEFCAAGIGERLSTEDNLLWAAFKAFDIQGGEDDLVTKDEIKKVLMKADVQRLLTDEICDELSDELFSRFDGNGDGSLDFQEWLRLMREISRRHHHPDEPSEEYHRTDSEKLLEELETAPPLERFDKAYQVLVEVNNVTRTCSKTGSTTAEDARIVDLITPKPSPMRSPILSAGREPALSSTAGARRNSEVATSTSPAMAPVPPSSSPPSCFSCTAGCSVM